MNATISAYPNPYFFKWGLIYLSLSISIILWVVMMMMVHTFFSSVREREREREQLIRHSKCFAHMIFLLLWLLHHYTLFVCMKPDCLHSYTCCSPPPSIVVSTLAFKSITRVNLYVFTSSGRPIIITFKMTRYILMQSTNGSFPYQLNRTRVKDSEDRY